MNIQKKVFKTTWLDIILKGGALVAFIITLSAIIGFIVSISTNFGRKTLYFMIIFSLFIYIQAIILFPLLKILSWFIHRKILLKELSLKYKYKI
jgi:hypothetical protein